MQQKLVEPVTKQEHLSDEERANLKQEFQLVYNDFIDNRKKLIFELEKIADKAVGVSKGCAISKLAGSSVGLGGGATALAGLVAFPPIVVFGGIAAGMAAVWNIGTQVAEYKLTPTELGDEVKQLCERDAKLVAPEVKLASAVGRGASEMFHLFSIHPIQRFQIGSGAEFAAIAGRRAASKMIRSGQRIATAEKGAAEMAGPGIEIASAVEEGAAGVIAAEVAGADAAVVAGAGTTDLVGAAGGEIATAAGVGSAEMVGLGGQVLQGVAQGAIVLGVAMDIATIISSARLLANESRTKFSDALREEVKRRKAELDSIRQKAIQCGLIEAPKPVPLHLMEPAKGLD
ncbi:unnamed protein product [Anisakis simplex]|uniref:Apolipoprotein L3 n=1 Tax=Anisakis simplex TaxID=6269 RepID=A0A158PP36_ANISI|nr:unnamed protein product [Anisakis simplex]